MVSHDAPRGIVFFALVAGASALSAGLEVTHTFPPKPTTTTRTTTSRTTLTISDTTKSYVSITTTTATTTTVTTATSSTTTKTRTTKTRFTKTSVTSTTGTTTTLTSTTYTRTWKRMRVRRPTETTTTGTTTTRTTTTGTKYPKPTTTTTLTTETSSTVTTTTVTTASTSTTTLPCTCGAQGKVLAAMSRAGTCADKRYTGFLFGGKPADCASMARFCRDPGYAMEMKVVCPVTCCAFSFQHPNASTAHPNASTAAVSVPIVAMQPEQKTGGAPEQRASSCVDSLKVPCKLLSPQCNSTEYGPRVRGDCPLTCGICRP